MYDITELNSYQTAVLNGVNSELRARGYFEDVHTVYQQSLQYMDDTGARGSVSAGISSVVKYLIGSETLTVVEVKEEKPSVVISQAEEVIHKLPPSVIKSLPPETQTKIELVKSTATKSRPLETTTKTKVLPHVPPAPAPDPLTQTVKVGGTQATD